MSSIASSTLPALMFATCVVLVYYLWARLWLTWLIRKARKKDPRRILTSRWAIVIHALAGIGLLCILYGWLVEPYWIQLNTIPIQTDKLSQTRFRVVQISDLHCDTKMRLEDDLPARINGLKPDIIVFTGDCLNSAAAQSVFTETLKRMEAPLGKFAVTGNWDFSYWSQLKLFEGTGFVELRSHTKRVEKDGESIVIAGLAFENGRHSQTVIDQLDPEAFTLLLYHNTSLLDYLDGKPVDLVLCGHTHGGQIALPFYGALTTLSRHGKKYEAGLYHQGPIQLYVNRGIGLEGGWAPRVRFCARPEIAVFDIEPKPF
jgi:hypothetical protein